MEKFVALILLGLAMTVVKLAMHFLADTDGSRHGVGGVAGLTHLHLSPADV